MISIVKAAHMIDGSYIYADNMSDILIATGDLFFPIVEFGICDCAGVVLSPMCDLAQQKIEWVKLALALKFKNYLVDILIPEALKGEKEYKEEIEKNPRAFGLSYLNDKSKRVDTKTLRLVKDLQRILQNIAPKKPSHYYLPGKEDLTNGFLVDFSYILSVPYKQLKETSPLLRLKSPWREQLLSRYVSFSLRVGTLDYSDKSICQTIKAFYPELTEEQIFNKMK
jgi:hypothetical protein